MNRANRKYYLISFVIVFAGILFRLYNLSWGSPFFFHPDERNIASAITQILFPTKLNPHFFAYGSLPIYVTYFGSVFINTFDNLFSGLQIDIWTVTFENAILMGRVISSFLSIFTLFVIYKAGKDFYGKKVGILAMLFASLSVGLIQYAHFSTFESWLSLLTLALFYVSVRFFQKRSLRNLVLLSVVLGSLVSIKISSLAYCIPVFLIIVFPEIKKFRIKHILLNLLISSAITAFIVISTSPFFWLDHKAFFSSISYESSVALGTLKVFYTQGFENSIPVLYQSIKVYPFIMNPFVWTASLIASFFVVLHAFRRKDPKLIILFVFLLITFASQAFLFVKWVRYYIPTLPFLYLILSVFLVRCFSSRRFHYITVVSIFFLMATSLLFGFSYFKTVLYSEDTRVEAAGWAANSINSQAKIISEVYDMGIVPFNHSFSDITLHNFYDLETDLRAERELNKRLKEADFIILPSQRVTETRLSNPHLYPKGNAFYSSLTSGDAYQKVYQTKCDIFCNILYLGSPQFSFEQTANVFDRPTVTIYKHVK